MQCVKHGEPILAVYSARAYTYVLFVVPAGATAGLPDPFDGPRCSSFFSPLCDLKGQEAFSDSSFGRLAELDRFGRCQRLRIPTGFTSRNRIRGCVDVRVIPPTKAAPRTHLPARAPKQDIGA